MDNIVFIIGITGIGALLYVLFRVEQSLQKLNKTTIKIEELDQHYKATNIDIQECMKKYEMLSDEITQLKSNLFDIANNINQANNFSSLNTTVHELETHVQEYELKLELRLHQIEEILKTPIKLQSSALDVEEIVLRYKKGESPQSIAKELRLSQSEVDFTLKIHKLR